MNEYHNNILQEITQQKSSIQIVVEVSTGETMTGMDNQVDQCEYNLSLGYTWECEENMSTSFLNIIYSYWNYYSSVKDVIKIEDNNERCDDVDYFERTNKSKCDIILYYNKRWYGSLRCHQ